MSRRLRVATAVGLSLAAAWPGMGQDENAPPFISAVSWQIEHFNVIQAVPLFGFYDPPVAYDPATDPPAAELDRITATLTIVDPDWAEAPGDPNQPSDEQVFWRFRARWVPVPGYLTPHPAPFPETDSDFQPEEGDGLAPGPNQTQVTFRVRFLIPEWIGRSQARLRGNVFDADRPGNVVDYDVRWLIEFCVANDQAPGEEDSRLVFCLNDGNIQCDCTLYLYGIENAGLNPGNPPAFADAGPDQTVAAGTQVRLDGSRTFDSSNVGFDPGRGGIFDRDVLVFAWEWISGPVRVDPVQSSQNDPIARVTLNDVGVYVYRLTVNDQGGSGPTQDSVTITVVQSLPQNVAPVARVSAPAGPATVGSVVLLDGSGSSDPNNDTLQFRWTQTDELGNPLPEDQLRETFQPLSGVQTPQVLWQALRTGTFHFRLLVSDGQLTSSARASVSVVEPVVASARVVRRSTASDVQEPIVENRPALPVCGGSLLPLGVVPVALLTMRGRLGRRDGGRSS